MNEVRRFEVTKSFSGLGKTNAESGQILTMLDGKVLRNADGEPVCELNSFNGKHCCREIKKVRKKEFKATITYTTGLYASIHREAESRTAFFKNLVKEEDMEKVVGIIVVEV